MALTTSLYETRDAKFILQEWLDMDKVLNFDGYGEYWTKEDFGQFVDLANKIAKDVVAPSNEEAEEIGVKFIDGKVIVPDGVKKAYWTIMQAGLGPSGADRDSEGKVPHVLHGATNEIFIAAGANLVCYWGITEGAVEVLQKYGSEEQKEKFCPKLLSGEWAGTMNLTEPQAGSDVGASATKAYPTDTAGLYKIKGTKQFITNGDNDFTENHIHMVLARIEGAANGTSGLSLFIVPKYWVNDDDSLGEFNDVTTVGIEHKMGLHGNSTCTLAYGENDNCYGLLIGEAPDKDGKAQGMKQMFVLMNDERMITSVLGLGVAVQAYFSSLDYAKTRIQGKKTSDPKGPKVRIIEHEDVRRMLLRQKACLEAIRAVIYKTYYLMDIAEETTDDQEREWANLLIQFSTPLCKAYATDMAWPLIAEAIQIYGGAGYIEEYPVAQLARDSKVFSIWEGTNYIQSMDLVGRKFTMGKGAALKVFLNEISEFIDNNKNTSGFAKEFEVLSECFADYQAILNTLKTYLGEGKTSLMPLYSTRILHASAMIYCGYLILDQAILAAKKLEELGEDHFDADFYKGKIASARFYILNEVIAVSSIKQAFDIADTSAIDMPEAAFGGQ